MPKILPALLVFHVLLTACQPKLKQDDNLVLNIMKQEPWQFQHFIDHKDSLEIQIVYTQINRDANNRPEFKSFYFNNEPGCYFYPASTVKFPVVLLALEKLNHLHIPGLDKFTPMFHDSVYHGQISVREDTTSLDCVPSVAHYIKKILVASDNDAHNRLYEFMGQKAANEIMWQKGYTVRFLQRVDRALTPDENRHTEEVCFVKGDSTLYDQPMLINDSLRVGQYVLKGKGYIRNDTLFNEPMDFTYKNFYPLSSQQSVLRAFLFPASVSARQRFDLSDEDRKFVLKYMSQLPTETFSPPYASDSSYFPAYGKYLMFGQDRDEIPRNIRIFNKSGNAYGYLIDNAYIVDFDNNVEFLLSAVIATNTDQIYNDGLYDYGKIGYPFMKNLGRLIYTYELTRTKKYKADLTSFKLAYDTDESASEYLPVIIR